MADLSDVERVVDNWERDAEQKAAKFQRMQEQVQQISITESVAGGAVSVTVGNNGIPTDVRMTEAVRQMAPPEIAANVLLAMQKAQAKYPEKLAEITAATIGDDPGAAHIVSVAAEQFPEPPEEPEPTVKAVEPEERQLYDTSTDIAEEPPPAPKSPPRGGTPPRRRPSTGDDDENDDDDFGDESVFER